jgi:PAS domain S-box-containing protein
MANHADPRSSATVRGHSKPRKTRPNGSTVPLADAPPPPEPIGDQIAVTGARLRAAQDIARELWRNVPAGSIRRAARADGHVGDASGEEYRLASQLDHALKDLNFALLELHRQQEALISMSEEIELGRQQYRDLFELAPDAYLVTNPRGEIIEANKAAETLFQIPAESLIGKLLGVYLVARDERPMGIRELGRIASSAETRREWCGRVRRRHEGAADVSVAAVAIRDPNTGAMLGARWLIRDITAQVRAESAVRELNASLEKRVAQRTRELERRTKQLAKRTIEVEAANQAKSAFLAKMSHEIRTPLNAISGYADLLDMGVNGPMTDPQREYVHRIRRSGGHLLGLVNDILNVAKLESGRVTYAIGPVPIDDILKASEAMVEPQARAKRLGFSCVACDPHCIAVADRERVLQIVLNLLTNAVKFTASGGRITLSGGNSNEHAWIEVRDTGCGIAPGQLRSIFEPFVQVGRPYLGPSEGVGLGLTISRDLARGMRGDLTVDSALGVGSAFLLTLPRGKR